ncbi:hypothetical protein [Cupriavidus basilensis]|uniref:hypothetical protein n=1 Tax=Cupriavidus basilensis TaxID=68895 RepID=UPI0020A68DA6|nr:hypothetical protein [Cupriavidus basilensis]MCP3024740.1 hypothetical protein [Cupriavidus basilensis]
MLAPALALCLGLSACSRHEAPPAAAGASSAQAAPASAAVAQADTLKREALILLAFPAWRDDDKGRVVRAALPDPDYKGTGEPPLVEGTIDVKPIQVIRLDDTHAVMLTEGMVVEEGGTRNNSHAAGAWLGAYFFTRDATASGESPGGWRLSRRVDGYDFSGGRGSLGESSIAKISATDFALTLTWGGCWQGYCGSWASFYRLAPGQISTLLAGEAMSAENAGALEPCEEALSGKSDVLAQRGADSQDAGEQVCFAVEGKPAFALGADSPGDLTVTFRGQEVKVPGGAAKPRRKSLDAVVRYRFQDGKYQVSQGENPVPSF